MFKRSARFFIFCWWITNNGQGCTLTGPLENLRGQITRKASLYNKKPAWEQAGDV